ncbi:MAG: CPBP family intramembrane metalloprotease [Clostridiales bacterium]|nr:CPBP family intramembrane metalloprotease [Clostridiales bacterium]
MNNYIFTPDGTPPHENMPYYTPSAPLPPNYPGLGNGIKGLRRLSITAGLCVLGFMVLQFAVYFILVFFGLDKAYNNNELFQTAFSSVYSIICVFLPFFVVALFMDDKRRGETLLFGKPYSLWLMIIAVPAGFMFCMAGNYATNALVTVMESFGVTLSAPENLVPSSVLGQVMFVIQIAFVPALIEEFALRGVVMQPLRKYGDRFAIVMSALVFALMHGNMIQAPFAFIAGLAIGYFVIATGSIWTGVLIHFVNNLFSALLNLLNANSSLSLDTAYAAVMTVAFVLGIACCVIFAFNQKRYKLRKTEYPISATRRFFNYIFTLPMIVALAAIAYITLDYIKFGG